MRRTDHTKTPEAMAKWRATNAAKRGTLRDRFERSYIPEPNSGCWLWSGSVHSFGYGQIRFGNKALYAHRVSLELAGRPLKRGQHACHRCDNPFCVNPDHLFAGTPRDNIRDAQRKGRLIPPKGRQGEDHHHSRLTAEAVQEIRRKLRAGVSQYALAKEYGVQKNSISNIAHGRAWKHLPDDCREFAEECGIAEIIVGKLPE